MSPRATHMFWPRNCWLRVECIQVVQEITFTVRRGSARGKKTAWEYVWESRRGLWKRHAPVSWLQTLWLLCTRRSNQAVQTRRSWCNSGRCRYHRCKRDRQRWGDASSARKTQVYYMRVLWNDETRCLARRLQEEDRDGWSRPFNTGRVTQGGHDTCVRKWANGGWGRHVWSLRFTLMSRCSENWDNSRNRRPLWWLHEDCMYQMRRM